MVSHTAKQYTLDVYVEVLYIGEGEEEGRERGRGGEGRGAEGEGREGKG